MADKPASAVPAQASTSIAFDKNKQASSSTPYSSTSLDSSASSSSSAPSIFASIHRRFSNSSMPSNPQSMDRPHASMAPPPPPMESKKLNMASLMSPPDVVLDSFHQGQSAMRRLSGGNGKQATSQQPLPMSPPISPYSKPITTANAPPTTPTTPPGQIVKDPVLYPVDEHSPASPPQPPLFAPAELEHHRRIVDEHVRARSQSIFDSVAPPRREDYELALTFRSQVMKHYMTNRKGWLRKERALLEADRRAGAQRYHAITPAKPIAAKLPRQRADRVSKPHASAPRLIRTNANATTNSTSCPTRPAGRTGATPEPSRRVVAPNREDKDFNSIVDHCPPLDSLPARANSLKVDWKGQPIDLSSDAYANLLHPDELLLAGNLRLDCATYLTSKRRIFDRRLQCLRTGKEFRKTDAQQACKIDVNKASKLWTAFDKVGWLDASWVRRFL
ncbi:hypothetical protein EsDP_00005787 [Epichloe bromicola]|uniref:SWIRM domain-containing protein n=1 Tax=Epichloe bromicola TaxID=79588 RepID=A0ABQ0CW55_9HYPO